MSRFVNVLVGTRKGAFIFSSNEARQQWAVRGPLHRGWAVQHMVHDSRSGRLFAALDHMVYGASVHYSDDMGASWTLCQGPIMPDGKAVKRIWHIAPGHPDRPKQVWAGGDPGVLFRSDDGGQSWQSVPGIYEHETRGGWFPGAGGLMVHTIIPDPTNADRIHIAISAAGNFRSDDGGVTWQPKNSGIAADFLPDPHAIVGQCCHHMAMSPHNPKLLFQQNHCGVYRSEDGGDSWINVTDGLPADFGFPIAASRSEPQTIFVIPEISPNYRHVPEGKLRVYRSRSGGDDWEALTNGLPQEHAYQHLYREAMATDALTPGGVYFGTTSGQLYCGLDEGESWSLLSGVLPPIYSVETISGG